MDAAMVGWTQHFSFSHILDNYLIDVEGLHHHGVEASRSIRQAEVGRVGTL